MQVFKHWQKLDRIAHDSQGREWDLRAWAGSGESEEEAQRKAEAKLDRWLAKLAAGDVLGDYEYQLHEIREELVEEIHGPAGQLIGAITRNRYGALVLNTASVLIADLDAEQPNILTTLLGWLGRKPRDKKYRLAALRTYVESQPAAHAVVYETCVGLRAFLTHEEFDPTGEASRSILTALGSDRLYQRLCIGQQCYRARLTPKPWRCGQSRPPNKFPRGSDVEQIAFRLWLERYERQSESYSVCRLLDSFGSGRVSDNAKKLLEIHDRVAMGDGRRVLA